MNEGKVWVEKTVEVTREALGMKPFDSTEWIDNYPTHLNYTYRVTCGGWMEDMQFSRRQLEFCANDANRDIQDQVRTEISSKLNSLLSSIRGAGA